MTWVHCQHATNTASVFNKCDRFDGHQTFQIIELIEINALIVCRPIRTVNSLYE